MRYLLAAIMSSNFIPSWCQISAATHSPEIFMRTRDKFEGACSKTIVMNRNDSYVSLRYDESRNWALNSDQIIDFLGFNKSAIVDHDKISLPICWSVSTILQSLSSTNSSRKCIIAWLSTPDVCQVLASYSEIIWIGDSLTRHTIMALYMILTENYRTGGYPIYPGIPQNIHNLCNCDGQFSENSQCRSYDFKENFLDHPIRKGLCPFDKAFSDFHFRAGHVYTSAFEHSKALLPAICSPGDGLRLIYLQGGAHYESKADRFFEEFIRQTIEEIKRIVSTCAHPIRHKVRVILSGIGACDDFLQKRFPYQNTSAVIRFNARVEELVNLTYPTLPIVTMDFLKVTEWAIADGRTSDGYHFLSDVNLIKAMSILNVMERMAVEQSFNVSFTP